MPPAHMSSADRRARRARRKRLRTTGRRLIAAGWVVVVVAVLVGAVGLRNALDGDDAVRGPVTASNAVDPGAVTSSTRRPSAVGAPGADPIVDLVPTTTAPGATVGDGGSTDATAGDAGGETFGVRTPLGTVQVQAAPRSARPRPNARPVVTAPAEVTRDANGDVVISGIAIADADYPGVGDIGVALIAQGTITVRLNQDVQLLSRNSSPFVGLAGPPAALNRALADLQFHSVGPVDLLITVTDWAYGDLTRSESGYATVRVR